MFHRRIFTAALMFSAVFVTPRFAQDAGRVDQLEQQIRELTGQVEELTFQVKQLRKQTASADETAAVAPLQHAEAPAAKPRSKNLLTLDQTTVDDGGIEIVGGPIQKPAEGRRIDLWRRLACGRLRR